MIYLWTIAVMAAAGCIVHRCLVMANAMDAKSNHGIRCGAWGLAVLAFGEILFSLCGRPPNISEGALVIALGLYFAAEKRRPVFKREREQQGVRA